MKSLALLFILICASAAGAQTVFIPTCAGTDDTAKFTTIIATIGSNTGSIRLPYKNASRCAVNTLTIPANVTLDNGAGTGIKVNTGQTLTTGPVVNPAGKQLFFNVGSSLGTVLMTNGKADRVDVSWFGTVNAANNSNAISAAIEIAMTATSPSATVYLPPGRWVIGTPIVKNISTNTKQSQLIIEGNGSTTNLVLGVGTAESALSLQNGHKIVIRDMAIVGNGVGGALWALHRGIVFSTTLQAVISNVEFYAITSQTVADGGVIHATNTHLTMRDVAFRACGGNSALDTGAVTLRNWNELSVENFHFIDFGVLNGVYYGSPSVSFGIFRLGNVLAPTINSYSGGYASFKNIVTDEGTWGALLAYTTDGSVIQSITVDNWRANITLATEFYFSNVRHVRISNSKVAYAANGQTENAHPGIYAENVDTLEVKNTSLLGPRINSIWLGAGVRYTRVEDSIVQRITNPNCTIVDEITAGELKPQVPCNAMAERAGSNAVKQYFNATTGKSVVSFGGHPPISTHGGKFPTLLADSFTEAAITAASWDSVSSTNITPTQVNNRLRFTVANSAGADATPGTYTTDNTYDFSKNGIVSVYLPEPVEPLYVAGAATFVQSLYVMAADGVTPIYRMLIDSGGSSQIIMVDDAGVGYNPLAYAPYWRIRYENGFVYFEISPNNSNWTTIRTSATSAAITSVKFVLAVQAVNGPASPTAHPTFDEFRFSQYYPALFTDDGITAAFSTAPTLTNGPQLTEGLLNSSINVNMNSGAVQVIYTCPTGKFCVVTKVVVRNATVSLTTASYSFQWNTTGDVITDATHPELTGSTLYTQLFPKVGSARGSAGATFDVLVSILQGSTASVVIDTFGYTF